MYTLHAFVVQFDKTIIVDAYLSLDHLLQTTVGRETNPDIHASSATVLAPGNEHTDRKVIDLNTSPRRSLENSSNN